MHFCQNSATVWMDTAFLIYVESVSACSLQHIEDASEIQELSKYRPHVLLTQENTQIKELQQENKGTK